jgi:protein-tyrosine phosphatase
VQFLHASLFVENTAPTLAITEDGPIVLPWQNRDNTDRRGAAHVYLSYLAARPDSILAALRLIATSSGATIVHCAAGKDRTGVVVALALGAVDVPPAAITEDYARTGERLDALLARLAASSTYAGDISPKQTDRHRPKPKTMADFLQIMDAEFGGIREWLAGHGWTDADQQALQAKLVQA